MFKFLLTFPFSLAYVRSISQVEPLDESEGKEEDEYMEWIMSSENNVIQFRGKDDSKE